MSYPAEIELGKYIVERWVQLGVQQIFGVPGDFNLEFLDFVEENPKLNWVGNANELNAGYAADGYARVKHNLGVVVTTFGVGELSALNAIAGSMSERLPILHLVGVPSTSLQAQKAILHHTLGNGSFNAFSEMSSFITATTGILKKGGSGGAWVEEVDRVLTVALTECRPVYLTLPTDLVHAKVSSEGLKTPLPAPHSAPPPSTSSPTSSSASSDVLSHVVSEITSRFEKSKNPIVIVDICADRFGCSEGLKVLIEKTGLRFFETPMGKSVLDETHKQFGGTYAGQNSLPAVRKEVEAADFVLMCGRLESDFNSGSFTFDLPVNNTVELHSFETKIGYASFPDCDIRTILPSLTESLTAVVGKNGGAKMQNQDAIKKSDDAREEAGEVPDAGKEITHQWFWPRVAKFFKDNDIVLAETGTSNFGIVNVPFPAGASCLTQTLWGSIGWATGATLGAGLAAKEASKERRTILFTGDGSIQLTIQEIGSMIRNKVPVYLFVLNNDGYEIERQIHGKTAKYNDIQNYDWQKTLDFFAGKSEYPHTTYDVNTPAELDKLLKDTDFNKPDRIRLIEVHMPRDNAPDSLIGQAKLTAEANAKA